METSEEKFFESLAKYAGGAHAKKDELDSALNDESSGALHAAARAPDAFSDGEPEGQLTIDVYQTPSDIIIESAIAGVKPEDIDISVSNDSITIRGERRREHEVKEKDYYYQECYWGRFSRSVIFPQEVDPESASVAFKNGILTVRLPKLSRKKTKKLKVKVE